MQMVAINQIEGIIIMMYEINVIYYIDRFIVSDVIIGRAIENVPFMNV